MLYSIAMDTNDLTDTKPLVRFTNVSYSWPESVSPVFDAFSADIPQGFISLVGPNGSGKSTFLLLAGGRIMADAGRIELSGVDTRILSGSWSDDSGRPGPGLTAEFEHKRNLLCSFIYQNMEFEEQGKDAPSIGALLEYVYENGGRAVKDSAFLRETVEALELGTLLDRKLDELSKGEIQRTLLSFSALYGSRVIMMDEPLFAMENRQKERALEFFGDIYRRSGVSLIVSLHELSLTRKYADTVLLFYPDRRIDMGTCDEVLVPEALEEAYGVPEAMLYDTEQLTRRTLLEAASQKLGG